MSDRMGGRGGNENKTQLRTSPGRKDADEHFGVIQNPSSDRTIKEMLVVAQLRLLWMLSQRERSQRSGLLPFPPGVVSNTEATASTAGMRFGRRGGGQRQLWQLMR